MRRACAVFFLLVWGLSSGALFLHWEKARQQRLSESNVVLATTYRASVAMYRLSTEILFEDVIQRPEIVATFAEGVLGSPATRDQARGKLYRQLAPAYTHLKTRGIHQLHFHTADGHSFLRFHAPDKFNDPLFDIRPSVFQANTQKRSTFGFEISRMNASFRYVFPLSRHGQHLGSVETGITFRAICEAMVDIAPGHEYLLALKKGPIERTLFREQLSLFATAPLHDDFLVEDSSLHLPGSPPPPSAEAQALNARLKGDLRVQRGMLAGETFTVPVAVEGNDWAVAFVPVTDLLGKNVAYLISYSPAPFLADLRRDLLVDLLFATLAWGGLFWLTLRLFNSHASLHREKQYLQIVADTIADGLFVMDPQGRIVQVNPAFTDILGYQAGEIVGKVGHNLFHVHEDGNEHSPAAECSIISATREGRQYTGEESFRHKSGRILTVELSCKPFIRKTDLEGSVTAFRDITERKAIEVRLQENDRIKSEFIATASHELRTPLTIIQGYTELLKDCNDLSPEQVRECESIIYDKAVALEKLIDELLDVSRIESGRPLCLDFAAVDIVEEIRQTLAHFQKEAADHDFSAVLPETKIILQVDRFKILQVFENLLNNAVKFSPAGSEITVSGAILGGHFQVTVADHGVGIAPEKQKHIFDKFFRVDTSNTALAGFGLGLYLVKRIVEAHQGMIWVESTLGEGTRFFFTLPLNR